MMEQQMQDQIEGGLINEESLYQEIMNYSVYKLDEEISNLTYKLLQLNEHGLGDSDSEKEKFYCTQKLKAIRTIVSILYFRIE